jgi:hypothetical protein
LLASKNVKFDDKAEKLAEEKGLKQYINRIKSSKK